MSEPTRGLTDEDVDQVTRLVESLDRSGFDFLQVELGDLRITVGTGSPPEVGATPPAPPPTPPVAAPVAVSQPVVPQVAQPVAQPVAQSVAPPPTPSTAAGGVEITAPTMGIFYARPEPGKPPFVAVGDLVEETTTVALVEVMKTFHSVAAGVRGTVVEICVSDTDFVEFGAVLMRVSPE
jgi:acetyl-CoA carboxylase biotin carboxyl carrier protein